MTDVADIAKGLSEAQRRAVLDHGRDWRRLCLGMGRGSGAARLRAITGLGLFEAKWGGDSNRFRLTPLGEQVRTYLESRRG